MMLRRTIRSAAYRCSRAGACSRSRAASARQTAPPAAEQDAAPARRGGGPRVPPVEETGFQPIFDGKTPGGLGLRSRFWRVEDGAIVGETTRRQAARQNIFLHLARRHARPISN